MRSKARVMGRLFGDQVLQTQVVFLDLRGEWQIVILLKAREDRHTIFRDPLSDDDCIEHFKFVKDGESQSIILVKKFRAPTVTNTVGRLLFTETRRFRFPAVHAISGWDHDPNQVVIQWKGLDSGSHGSR
jgi:hypothetical protein